MPNNTLHSNAALLSGHGTSAHETGFQRLSSLIPNLHEAHIRYKKNRVTGVFNISGRKTTMGATSLPELIEKLLQKEAEYREYIRQNRKKGEMHKNGL